MSPLPVKDAGLFDKKCWALPKTKIKFQSYGPREIISTDINMQDKIQTLYSKIIEALGGADNISSLGSCMTRLRFTLKNEELIDQSSFKQIKGVLGYIKNGRQHQLILGPGICGELSDYIHARHQIAPLSLEEPPNPNEPALESKSAPHSDAVQIGKSKEVKAEIKRKYAGVLSRICSKIGNIFLPLIPAYIACGLILGVNNILSKLLPADYSNVSALLSVFGNGIFFYLSAIVGYNANKEFGGTPALGVVFAGILNIPSLSEVSLFGIQLSAGKGGIIAVLAVCYFGSMFEKFLKKHFKGSTDMFLTPTITVLVIGFLSLIAIQPAAGCLSDKLALFTQKAIERGGVFTGFILAGSFLPVVMLGIHQSLIPLYQHLIDTLGNNPLFPILCMAGAGQVGASIAVLAKTKNTRLKQIIKNALPVGILGIGEPLIYGVTLPLFKPFITACIGAAFGGAVISALHATAAIPFGVSGVVLLLAMSNLHSTIFYFIGLLTAAAAGFIATWLVGFDDPAE